MSHRMSKPPRPARRPGWGATRAVLDALAAQDILLTQEERERANAFAHDADRRDFIAAHRLVRAMAASIIGAPPGTIVLRQRCDTCGGPHGRPTLPDHPAACQPEPREGRRRRACGDRPVGIDLERWNASQPDHSDLDFALAPAERKRLQSMAASDADADAPVSPAALAFLRLWVRKECLVNWAGSRWISWTAWISPPSCKPSRSRKPP